MATRKNSQNHRSGILNVLLHGAFTFIPIPREGRILALIPRLQEHSFIAGPFMAETELRGGPGASYELEGVDPGRAHEFDPKKNLLVKFSGKLPDSPRPYATLIFPLPRKITTLRTEKVESDKFRDRRCLAVDSETQHMSTLQVLTYDFKDVNALKLKADHGDGHYWEPAFTGVYVNLLIYSAEAYYHRPSNSREDINECIKLLGVKLQLETRFALEHEALDDGVLPQGVAWEETEVLSARTLRMARLGRLVVQGGDANLAWYGNDALDGGGGCDGCVAVLGGKK